MRLASVQLRNLGPFDDLTVRFAEETSLGEDAEAAPPPKTRPVTILFGGSGTGKTSLLSAIGVTRPGCALPPLPAASFATSATSPSSASAERERASPPSVVTEWLLGRDDEARPHPLVVATSRIASANSER